MTSLPLITEFDTEEDKWVCHCPVLPGVMESHREQAEAVRLTEALAFRVMADRLEHGEPLPAELFTIAAA